MKHRIFFQIPKSKISCFECGHLCIRQYHIAHSHNVLVSHQDVILWNPTTINNGQKGLLLWFKGVTCKINSCKHLTQMPLLMKHTKYQGLLVRLTAANSWYKCHYSWNTLGIKVLHCETFHQWILLHICKIHQVWIKVVIMRMFH